MRALIAAFVSAALIASPAFARGGGHGGSSHGSHSSRSYTPHYGGSSRVTMPKLKRDARGRIKRSASAKRAFQAQSPCPATGKTAGACSGFVIDHVKPLSCGGADAPSNMQWQTTADAKAKDRWERKECGR